MSRLKYAFAGASALALFAIPMAAEAGKTLPPPPQGCESEVGFVGSFAGSNELSWLPSTIIESVVGSLGGAEFRRGGDRRGRLSHKCAKKAKRVFTADGAQTTTGTNMPWNFGTYLDQNAYSAGGDFFATDWLTVSGNAGAFRDDDSGRLLGINNDGFLLGGGLTAYTSRNFAFDAFVDYTDATLFGVSTNSHIGGEYLPFDGVPLSLYGGYDRTEFKGGGGLYDMFSIGFTAYLGAERKSDLRSYRRGQ